MIFLVDGSWSIGHSHFQQVKAFLASIIEPFEIGPDKVQVGEFWPHALKPHPGDPQAPPRSQRRREASQGLEESFLLAGVACSTSQLGAPAGLMGQLAPRGTFWQILCRNKGFSSMCPP